MWMVPRALFAEKVDAQISNVDRSTRKLTLSIKVREVREEKEAMAQFGSSDSGASLGDILGAAISKANEARGDAGDDETADDVVEEAVEEVVEAEPAKADAEAEADKPGKED